MTGADTHEWRPPGDVLSSPASFERVAVRMESERIQVLDHYCIPGEFGKGEVPIQQPALGFVRNGLARLRLGRTEGVVGTAEMALFLPGTTYSVLEHSCEPDRPEKRPCATTVQLNPEYFPSLESSRWTAARPGFFNQDARELHYWHRLCRSEIEWQDPLEFEEATCAIVDSLGERFGPRDREAQHRLVPAIKAYLAEHVFDKVSLDEVSDAVAYSKFHMCRVFKASTGTTIYDYLTHLRIREALKRLDEGEENLSRLAVDIGFANHSHFTARFREILGTTPSAVRHGRFSPDPSPDGT